MLIALLPYKHGICGPVTARRLIRLLLVYLVLFSVGLWCASYANTQGMRIFGLGLMLPGGGFLAHADVSGLSGILHIALGISGILLFGVGIGIWFATGNVLAPPAVWLLLAFAAATMNHGHVHDTALPSVISIIIAIAVSLTCLAAFVHVSGRRARKAGNEWLQLDAPVVAAGFAGNAPGYNEFSWDDLKRMRFLLDRSLQPVPEFNGFEWLDQFQTAAIRYQLNFMGYALSMAHATHLPAFRGYIADAQRNLIAKLADYRVWRYWTLENLWGNLRYNPDPVAWENIMYSGFCALQMEMFHSASGARDFEMEGSFTLTHPGGRTYRYSLPSLVAALGREAQRSDFHLVACEPNWIYPLCNTIGTAAVKGSKPDQWGQQEASFRKMLEQEFLDAAGRIIPCRSNHTGLALPCIGGAMPQAMPAFFLNAVLPDVALRQWLLLRRRIVNGGVLLRNTFWRIDTGNYGRTRAAAYAATALAASELGDTEVKALCLSALDEECPVRSDNGHFYRPGASVWAHAVEFFARSAVPHGFRTLLTANSPEAGPYIAQASYPGVLVAHASNQCGQLRAIFYPGDGAGMKQVTLAGLIPGKCYCCRGSEEQSVIANTDTTAILHIALDGRREITVEEAV